MSARVEFGMPNDDYRASAGLSHSELKLLRQRTPYHLKRLRENPPAAKKATPQMVLGTALHCAVLEPEAFPHRYCDDLDENRNTKVYREFAQQCANFGLIPLSTEDRERIDGMREALLAHPRAAEALAMPGHSEVSAWWRHETGILCKCRPDRVCDLDAPHGKTSVLLDLKTTSDASRDAFSRSIHTFGYHTQAEHYTRGYSAATGRDCEGMLFLVVESDYPHACAAYELDAEALRVATELNADAMRLYASCVTRNEWPGFDDAAPIGLPGWALREAYA